MPILTLMYKNQTLAEHRLDPAKPCTIGRHESNDLVVDNLGVSTLHAKLDLLPFGWVVTDMESKNGTFVNEAPITSHRLAPGDVITVGKHRLVFSYLPGEALPPAPPQGIEETKTMATRAHRAMVSRSLPPEHAGPLGTLVFLGGPDETFVLRGKLTRIGKDEENDIVVGGLMVAGTAATITWRPDGYYLTPVGGLLKPRLNDVPVDETRRLTEFDVIEIGSAKMQLVFKRG